MAGGRRGTNRRGRGRSGRPDVGGRRIRNQRRRRRLVIRVGGIAVAGLIAGTTFLASVLPGSGAVASSPRVGPVAAIGIRPAPTVSLVATAPPWHLPSDARPYIAAAGLALHNGEPGGGFEVHLDIRAGGHRVSVPAGVGDATVRGAVVGVSGLYTDDTSGVLHVVGHRAQKFTLGQFFTEWGVPLSETQLGGFTAGVATRFVVAVDGRPTASDPAAVVLHPHEEIALWLGPTSTRPRLPGRYRFS